jgi:O-antigen/teichoic acid export membrane protein
MQIILSMDNLAIGHMLGVSAVASYALAFQLVLISRQALTRLGRVLVPLYSRHDALEERQLSARIFLEVSSISAALGTILTVFLALFGGDLIRLWVGAQNFVGWTTLWLLCPFVLIQSIVEPGQLALLSIRRHRLVALLRGVEALLKAVLTLLLVRRWGVAGAAFSTLFAAVSITSWSLPLVTLREFQIPVATYLRRAVVPQVALGLFLLLAGRLLVRWWRPDNLLQVVFVAALMALLYGLLYWFLFLNQGQRAFYLRLAGGLFHEEH